MWIRRCAAGSAPAVSPIVHVRSAQVGIGERESRRGWGQQLVVRGQLHSPMVKLVMRVAHVAPIRARCFNSKRTSFHVALELEHVESVDLRSAIRKADAVLPAFARAGQRGDTLKRVARRGGCRLLFRLGVQHIGTGSGRGGPPPPPPRPRGARGALRAKRKRKAHMVSNSIYKHTDTHTHCAHTQIIHTTRHLINTRRPANARAARVLSTSLINTSCAPPHSVRRGSSGARHGSTFFGSAHGHLSAKAPASTHP